MSHDLFYVFAGALIVVALVISLLGIRKTDFPSGGVLKGVLALIVVLVAGTAYFAVDLASYEKAHRLGEENEQASEESQESDIQNQENEAGGTLPGEGEGEGATSTPTE